MSAARQALGYHSHDNGEKLLIIRPDGSVLFRLERSDQHGAEQILLNLKSEGEVSGKDTHSHDTHDGDNRQEGDAEEGSRSDTGERAGEERHAVR